MYIICKIFENLILSLILNKKEEQENTQDDTDLKRREYERDLVHKHIYEDIFLHQENQPFLNDVEIYCSNGVLRAPALLLASISPVFKASAPVADIGLIFL